MKSIFLPLLAWAGLFVASPARAQLDLGSQDIPQDSIDAYMAPFYRLIACGLGADRHLPLPTSGSAGPRFSWHAGLQGGAVPVPDGRLFREASLAALPVFRLEGGLGWEGLGIMVRGLTWSDPRMGDLATYGGGISLGRGFQWPSRTRADRPVSLAAALTAGWDRMVFESRYTYRYRGSLLSLFDQDIPGDYALSENLAGFGVQGSLGLGRLRLGLEALYERASGRFRHLYLDPRSGKNSTVTSDLEQTGFRSAAGLSYRGFRLQAGYRDFPYLSAGWSYGR